MHPGGLVRGPGWLLSRNRDLETPAKAFDHSRILFGNIPITKPQTVIEMRKRDNISKSRIEEGRIGGKLEGCLSRSGLVSLLSQPVLHLKIYPGNKPGVDTVRAVTFYPETR